MNMEKLEPFEALINEMDDKMISGKLEVTHDTMRLISALRLVIRDSNTTQMQAMMCQSDRMLQCERLEEEVDEKADEIRTLRRQMGIWRAKAKRLEDFAREKVDERDALEDKVAQLEDKRETCNV